LGKLEAALVCELEEEGDALRLAVEALPAPDTDARIAMLRRCVKIVKRCCADDAEGSSKVLAAQERLVAAIGANSLVPAAGDDLVELAVLLEAAADYKRAMEMLERAMALKLSEQPAAPPAAVASVLHRQGALYAIMGQYEEALERFGRAVSMRREALGDAHPDLATSHDGFGNVYYELSRYDESLQHYERALEIRTSAYGRDHLECALSLNNIGWMYQEQGKYREALDYFHQDLEITTRLCGADNVLVAKAHNCIGIVHKNQGDFANSLSHLYKALEIRKRCFGDVHYSVGASHNNIARTYEKQGDSELALAEHAKALEIRLGVFGAEHPDVAHSKYDIASLEEEAGRLSEARSLFLECEQIYTKFYGADNEMTLDAAVRASALAVRVGGGEDEEGEADIK
jgi:tetratricopeptide (TPR) repeat protein